MFERLSRPGGGRFNFSTAYQDIHGVAGSGLPPFFVDVKMGHDFWREWKRFSDLGSRIKYFMKCCFLDPPQEFNISNASHQFRLENRGYFHRQFLPPLTHNRLFNIFALEKAGSYQSRHEFHLQRNL